MSCSHLRLITSTLPSPLPIVTTPQHIDRQSAHSTAAVCRLAGAVHYTSVLPLCRCLFSSVVRC